MLNANFASYPYVSPVNSYAENLGRAARGFVAALLAIDPVKAHVGPPAAEDATVDHEISLDELELMARRFESTMPNQAAELRYLVSRT
ncbi:hypothetical protein EDC30_10867 [Paucimonas lemoignei]|uniref:Uncharacterized protein n=1 Tax=Paucimonas lemoignei TaxID=29443 RepID=A0A4R3HTH7_PAULE|nr:hypothetical protein [Paucimonas lemoignei]TCS36004.1 hypothetical protein EDC30_10867 [Paucimonas lemoignei]